MKKAALLLLLAACKSTPDVTPAPPPSVTPAPLAPPPPPAASSAGIAPAPVGKAAAITMLLQGDAGGLPLRATDPGRAFDPEARDKIAPRDTSKEKPPPRPLPPVGPATF